MNWLEAYVAAVSTRMAHNPLFVLKARQLGWPRTGTEFAQYMRWLLAGGTLLILIWLGISGFDALTNLTLFLIALNVSLTLAADPFYLMTALLSTRRLRLSGQWDELCLTPLDIDGVLQAEQALAELRGWRVTVAQIVARLLLLGALVLAAATRILGLGECFAIGFAALLAIIAGIGSAPVLARFCVFNPLRHMQAIVRLGVIVAARTQESGVATPRWK